MDWKHLAETASRIYAGYGLWRKHAIHSNGGISSQNPGTEALVFSICIPVMEN